MKAAKLVPTGNVFLAARRRYVGSAPGTTEAPGIGAAAGPFVGLDPLRISLFLLTVLTLSRVHQQFAWLAGIRPALLLAALAATYAFLNPRAMAPGNLLRTWPAQVIVALAVVACLSVPFGIAMGRSANFIVQDYSSVLVFAFLLIAAIRCARHLFLFVWAYVVACGILSWMMIFVFELAETPNGRVLRLGGLHTYDANDAALVLTVGLPLTLLTLQASRWPGKIASALILVGTGVALARSGSRGALVGVVVVALALALSLRGVSLLKRATLLGAVASALALAAPPGYWEQMKTLLNPTEDYNWESVDGRKAVAARGVGYMLDRPFFGLGIHNFGRAEGTISEKALEQVPGKGIRWTAPHNSFVQVGAELGVPGLVLWSSLLVGGIVSLGRIRRRLPPDWARGDREERFIYLSTLYLPVSLLGFGVTASFLSFAYADPIYVLASFVAGVFVSLRSKRERDRLAAEESG